jgi:hypothetical protein
MPKTSKKPRMKITELAPKMKIIKEIKPELQEEAAQEEASLEELAFDAPSSKEFPSLSQHEAPIAPQGAPEIPQTTAETREEEKPASPRYAIQRDVTEKELRKTYESRVPGTLKAAAAEQRSPLILTERERREEAFRNREIASLRAEESEEEDKYTITPGMQHSSKERKYPWEA